MSFDSVVLPATGTSTEPNDTLTSPASTALYATTLELTAACTSTRPLPTRPVPYWLPVPPGPVNSSCTAVFMTSALSSSTVHVGCNCRSSAMIPEMCGVADDVPLNPSTWVPVRLCATPTT